MQIVLINNRAKKDSKHNPDTPEEEKEEKKSEPKFRAYHGTWDVGRVLYCVVRSDSW